jgi:hypothetical protein
VFANSDRIAVSGRNPDAWRLIGLEVTLSDFIQERGFRDELRPITAFLNRYLRLADFRIADDSPAISEVFLNSRPHHHSQSPLREYSLV